VSVPILIPRVTIAAVAPLSIAAAMGLGALRPSIANLVGAIVFVMLGYVAWQYTHTLTKEDWRHVASDIASQAETTDLIVVNHHRSLGLLYYLPNPPAAFTEFPLHSRVVRASDVLQLDTLVHNRRRIWLVLGSNHDDPTHLVEQALSKNFAMADRREYKGVTVKIFDAR
jgi:hypothetical protein